jgi:hypothetical protein
MTLYLVIFIIPLRSTNISYNVILAEFDNQDLNDLSMTSEKQWLISRKLLHAVGVTCKFVYSIYHKKTQ